MPDIFGKKATLSFRGKDSSTSACGTITTFTSYGQYIKTEMTLYTVKILKQSKLPHFLQTQMSLP